MQYGYIAHHGIKGQKWGIRRYQTENGTLTAEGRKRYGLDGHKVEGTLKERMRGYKRQARQIDRLRRADYEYDMDRIKEEAKIGLKGAAARNKEINEYKDYYLTGQRYLAKEVKKELSKKYGHDAVKAIEKQQTMAAVATLAGTVVLAGAVGAAEAVIDRKINGY